MHIVLMIYLLTEQITKNQAYTLYCAVGVRYAPCINITKVTNFIKQNVLQTVVLIARQLGKLKACVGMLVGSSRLILREVCLESKYHFKINHINKSVFLIKLILQ